MEILGVGASELIFILLIAIVILGPNDMQKAGKTIGRWLNQMRQSDGWKVFQQTSSQIKNIPNTLMREANLEMLEAEKDLRRALDPRAMPTASKPGLQLSPLHEPENSIQPPRSIAQADVPPGASIRDNGESKSEENSGSTSVTHD